MKPQTLDLEDSGARLSKLTLYCALVTLSLLVAVTYWNSLENDFAFDDHAVILGNRQIVSLANLPNVLVSAYWAGTGDSEGLIQHVDALYRPLVITSYAFNYAIGGTNPVGYRIINVILHGLVTTLVLGIALQLGLGVWAALISAALFAVHPIHVEAVTYVVGRAELLMTTGVLASLWWANRGQRTLSVMAFILGLLSKEQAILLPLLVMLFDFCTRAGRSSPSDTGFILNRSLVRAGLARYGAYGLVLVAYVALRLHALDWKILQTPGFLENPPAFAGWSSQVLTAIKVAGMYVWLFMWPASLAADYSYAAIPISRSLLEPGVLLGLATWSGLLALTWWGWIRRARTVVFCVFLTLLSYLPVSNVIFSIGTIMGERLFYLPSVGLCLLIGMACDHFIAMSAERQGPVTVLQPSSLLWAVVIVVCLAMSVRSTVRNRDWRNNETLHQSTVEVVPNNAKAHALLGHALAKTGVAADRERAIEAYQNALSIYPDYFHRDSAIIGTLSALLLRAGRSSEARELLDRTVASDPDWGVLHYFLALHFAGTGQPERAEEEWLRAISLSPGVHLFRAVYSRYLIERGRYAEGLTASDEVLRQRPEFVLAVFNRALALQGLGRLDEAAAVYERVLAMPGAPVEAKQDAHGKLENLRTRLNREPVEPRGCLPGLAGC